MKIKCFVFALVLLAVAICSYAQEEKISVNFNNTPIKACLDQIFKGSGKSYGIDPNVQNGVINLVMIDQPFNKILSKILSQVNATYEYEDGYYDIKSTAQNGMVNGRPNQFGNNNVGPQVSNGGFGNNNVVPGGNNMQNMGGNRNVMGGQNQTPANRLTSKEKIKKKIKKIKVFYNSPDQVLAMMDGDAYVDVVWSNSGNSNSSNNSNGNNNNSNNNSNNNRNNRNSNR